MGITKKVMTAVLSGVLAMSMAASVFAATSSPTDKPSTKANPGYIYSQNMDVNTQDHGNGKAATVTSKVGTTNAIVRRVESASSKKTYLALKVARNSQNKTQPITHLGNGTVQPFNNKTGKYITNVDILSTAATFKIGPRAFGGSNVKVLRIAGKNISISKDAFTTTNVKNPQIQICGTNRKASQFTFAKGCFNKLNSKAEIVVKSTSMTVPQYNLLVKKLKAAGFPGKIRRGKP